MRSKIGGKIALLVHKVTLNKNAKKSKQIKLKNLKAHLFFQSSFWDTLGRFLQI